LVLDLKRGEYVLNKAKKISSTFKNSKIEYILFVFIISIISISCFIVHCDQEMWRTLEIDWSNQLPSNLRCHIDYVKEENDSYLIEGYAFIHGENLNIVNSSVVLFDDTNKQYFQIKTDVYNRGDLSAYFAEGYEYDDGRFIARVQKKHLIEGHSYIVNVLFKCNNYNFLIPTNERIFVNER